MRDLAVLSCVIGVLVAAPRASAQTHGVELQCNLSIRPYFADPYTGEHVRATPQDYELRTVGDGSHVDAESDGWTVRSASMRIEYEIVERATGRAVLRDTAELACGRTLPHGTPEGVIELVPGRVFFGATITHGPDDSASCGGEGGPQQWYVVHLASPARLSLRLVSEFDATIYVREGAIDGPEVACRDRRARLETFDMHLPAGTYFVAVDGTHGFGRYRLVSFYDPVDPRAIESAPHGELHARDAIESELVPAASRYHGSCGGTQAPEHLYALRVDHAARFSFRLASRFDSALYLLSENGDELGCRSTVGLPGGWRQSRVALDLAPGVYWVVVDGESAVGGAGTYRLVSQELPAPE
ncbi:hypothetical protein [Sandaracinus amylolyticus]|uniref:hypothetical protein n=1 Tax=Sandaracinus amylolyticus TaxID=927083 RepID=UPI001F40B082|nr:hypothetical protein [Sandaracinus amylolyticus]UJR82452.1 Hypothetical protein I5071_45170 [Sandaracinus amylolyticus]